MKLINWDRLLDISPRKILKKLGMKFNEKNEPVILSRYDYLEKYIVDQNPINMIEIGVWKGDRAEQFIQNVKSLKHYVGFDLFENISKDTFKSESKLFLYFISRFSAFFRLFDLKFKLYSTIHPEIVCKSYIISKFTWQKIQFLFSVSQNNTFIILFALQRYFSQWSGCEWFARGFFYRGLTESWNSYQGTVGFPVKETPSDLTLPVPPKTVLLEWIYSNRMNYIPF